MSLFIVLYFIVLRRWISLNKKLAFLSRLAGLQVLGAPVYDLGLTDMHSHIQFAVWVCGRIRTQVFPLAYIE